MLSRCDERRGARCPAGRRLALVLMLAAVATAAHGEPLRRDQSAVLPRAPMAQLAADAERLTLADALALAERNNAALQAALRRQDTALAGVVTARQRPNPDVEALVGPVHPRPGMGNAGTLAILGFTQPLEYAELRAARARGAEAGVDAAEAVARTVRRALHARVSRLFFEVMLRGEQVRLADEEVATLQQIRDRILLRVQVGESPKLDLIRADTELLNAQRRREAAVVRVIQASDGLAALIGLAPLAPGRAIQPEGVLPPLPALESLAALRERALKLNPEIAQAEAERRRAQARLGLEEQLRRPQFSLRAAYEHNPEANIWRIGVSVPLPLFHRREGQIAEARADLSVAEALGESRRQTLRAELEFAYSAFVIAHRQVEAFEGGLLEQAEQALRVAEAAFRFGERGIIEFLDAQRTLRAVRFDYVNALYDARFALLEIERLLGADLIGGVK
jgi:cobalt-zinc-cadmium efflux system outer membrane protein